MGELADKPGMDNVEEWLKSKAISTDSREPVLYPLSYGAPRQGSGRGYYETLARISFA